MIDLYQNDVSQYINTDASVIDAGFMGYQGRSGLYVPTYSSDVYKTALSSLGNADYASFVAESSDFWRSLQIPEVIQLYATQNDTDIVHGLSERYRFTPPWCNSWNVDGSGSNCADIKAEIETYDKGQLHQVIVNRGLNLTVSYWGISGLETYVSRKLAKNETFIFKYWAPTKFISANSLSRLSLPPYTQMCYSNNTNSLAGDGSVDCDYPQISLRKVASPKVMPSSSSSPYHDFGSFLRRLNILQSEMDDLLQKASNSSLDMYDIACQWIGTKTTTWPNWISNTFQAPEYKDWYVSASNRLGIAILSTICANIIMGGGNNITDSLCTAQLWVPSIGSSEMMVYYIVLVTTSECFVIALGALGAKTYRIYQIFFNQGVHPAALTVLISTFGVILLGMTKLAYDAREAPEQFNEAKELAMALYVMIVGGAVGVSLIFWEHSRNEFEVEYLIIAMFLCLVPIIVLITMFGWRLNVALFGYGENSKHSSRHTCQKACLLYLAHAGGDSFRIKKSKSFGTSSSTNNTSARSPGFLKSATSNPGGTAANNRAQDILMEEIDEGKSNAGTDEMRHLPKGLVKAMV
eukprot:jgi/Bigna1/138836/aug1.47_g13544